MILSALLAFFPMIENVQDMAEVLPFSESAIEQRAEESRIQFLEDFQLLLSIPENERTFENTVRAWDSLNGGFRQAMNCIRLIGNIHPDASIRDSANKKLSHLSSILLDELSTHPEIYDIFLRIASFPELNEEERHYLDSLLTILKGKGFQLPPDQRIQFAQAVKEVQKWIDLFHRNVSVAPSRFFLKDELAGLDEAWIASKEQDENGSFRLTADLPTFSAVMNDCTVRNTRKALFELFNNRGFPENEEVIEQLLEARDRIAKIMGFPNFASYDLSFQMAESVERVEGFLKKFKEKTDLLVEREFQALIQDLPEGISLSRDGKLEFFDQLFALNHYKKKHSLIDATQIAEYFPLENTLEKLIYIFETFFSLSIVEKPNPLPLPDVKALEIRDASGRFLGVLFLDLFPRTGKIAHQGICYSLLFPFSPSEEKSYAAAGYIIGNFTKPFAGRPSLLTHSEAICLFHEFGHGLHQLLGRSPYFAFSGLQVKGDFVELPSSLLENWLWDPTILKLVSSHYLTGKPLPDETIDRIVNGSFGLGYMWMRMCFLSELSLALHSSPEVKNPTQLVHRIYQENIPHTVCNEKNHFHDAWWHLPEYAAKYYSYLWSEALAADLFQKIKKQGLLNPEAGAAYADAILRKGGSCDPNLLLLDYLGREPNFDACFSELEIDD